MAEKSDCKCNAPCIINSPHAPLYTVFCGDEAGHSGDHSYVIRDSVIKRDRPVVVFWNYLGKISENTASPFSPECSEWSQNPPLQRFDPDSEQFIRNPKLLFSGTVCTLGFCCEKPRGHEDDHVRTGTYGPLGINWTVEW